MIDKIQAMKLFITEFHYPRPPIQRGLFILEQGVCVYPLAKPQKGQSPVSRLYNILFMEKIIFRRKNTGPRC